MTAPAEIAVRRAAAVVAAAEGFTPEAVLAPSGRAQRRARRLAAYLAVTGCNIGTKGVARAVGYSAYRLREALRRIEEQRDDPDFDQHLDRLSEGLAA